MATAVFFLLIASIFVPGHAYIQHTDQAFTSIVISQKGLDFLKDLLVEKAISSMVPLQLPQIVKNVKIPFVGNVRVELSNTTIYQISVASSYVKPSDSGVVIIESSTTCNLSMNWHYSYSTWLLPIDISDKGTASVLVDGMEVVLTLAMEVQQGTIKLSLIDCGCFVEDISIKLDGGASWLYQGMIDAFEGQIGTAVENAISKNLREGILKLDSYLQSLPKEITVDENASLNVTIANNPLLSSSSIGFEINGLFIPNEKTALLEHHHEYYSPSLSFTEPSKMLGITLDEAVFNSAAALYYDAEFLQWIVDKVPDQALLTTAGWRFIVPQLYKKYPNHDMNLNISLPSPPVVRISKHNIGATVYLDLIIDVLEASEVIPVACISLEIRGSGLVKISGNNLAGSVKLNDFVMSLKWSSIGKLRTNLIQPVMWTIIQTVVLPYANSHLANGFPLPIVHGFTLQEAEIVCSDSIITVSSDVVTEQQYIDNLRNLFKSIK